MLEDGCHPEGQTPGGGGGLCAMYYSHVLHCTALKDNKTKKRKLLDVLAVGLVPLLDGVIGIVGIHFLRAVREADVVGLGAVHDANLRRGRKCRVTRCLGERARWCRGS